jgi:pimeloyl-ACP methyl ester carboxylesterase
VPIATVGDLDLAWDEFGSGEPVLMIYGIGADRTAWHLQTPALARVFRAITLDNRDVGETGAGRDPRPYGMRRFAASGRPIRSGSAVVCVALIPLLYPRE